MKQEQRAQMTRDRIMKAAMEVFGTRGYDGGCGRNRRDLLCESFFHDVYLFGRSASRAALYILTERSARPPVCPAERL